jgi:hypothetical protein
MNKQEIFEKLGTFERVEQFQSKNQFILIFEYGVVLQSYQSIIAIMTPDRTYLDNRFWNYSVTTGRYRNLFLSENIDITRKKIKSGEYELVSLN